jgi:RNA polymerase sigma-70 factor (ECF subfamily)
VGRGVTIDVEKRTSTEPSDIGPIPSATTFEPFFADQYPRLVRLLVARTGRRDLAEELAQEAMLRAHVRWTRISRYDDPAAWVRRVGLNLCSNWWARTRTERRLVERLGSERPPPPALPAEDDEFWAAVRSLPDRQASAIVLHYVEDRSVADVARIMGCALGTAKAHLHKGRAHLATLLDTTTEDDE